MRKFPLVAALVAVVLSACQGDGQDFYETSRCADEELLKQDAAYLLGSKLFGQGAREECEKVGEKGSLLYQTIGGGGTNSSVGTPAALAMPGDDCKMANEAIRVNNDPKSLPHLLRYKEEVCKK